jgi:hypothetical protein
MTGRVLRRRGDAVLAGDVARLNDLLDSGVSFTLENAPPRREVGGGHPTELRVPEADDPTRRASGVLELETPSGTRARASCPVTMRASRRAALHSLAACLAECAMSLGVGTGIYRRSSATAVARLYGTARRAGSPGETT